MLTATAPSPNGTVKALITFEDESGNPVSFEREFVLDVYEEVYEEPVIPEDMMPEETSGPNVGLIAGIAAAAAAVIVIIVIVVIRKKKKKAAALKQEDDFLNGLGDDK